MKKDPTPRYSRKSIYRIWHEQASKKWKRDCDEVKSAKILLGEASQQDDKAKKVYTVEEIPIHNEEGFTAIAFSLPEIVRKWGGKIRELSLDSACMFTIC